MRRRPRFDVDVERDDATFPPETKYRVTYGDGVAWTVWGWELESDEDTEWSGQYVRTGRVLAIMVGDDAWHTFDPSDLMPLADLDYCTECGQIGCQHDGRERAS